MKIMTNKEIDQIIANVQATLAVENLTINKYNIMFAKKYLKGQISSEKAIENITKYIENKMLKQ